MASAVRTFPSKKDEKWRYSPIADLEAAFQAAEPSSDTVRQASVSAAQVAGLLRDDQQDARLMFVNGHYDPALSSTDLPSGVSYADGVITVEPFTSVSTAIHLVHCGVPSEHSTLADIRLRLDVGARSKVSVVQSFCAVGGSMVTDANTSLHVGESASVHLTRVQSEPAETVHVGFTGVTLDAGAQLDLVDITIGGDIARHEVDVRFDQPGARFGAHGLFLPTGTQRHDTVIVVDHAASHCASQQDVRGVVDDKASGSFSGHIVVRQGTVDTDAHQSNRNMALTRTAEVNSRPWLEILADDVRCTHGSTVGQLDDDAVFYMRSRGIPEAEARSMLIDAFISLVTEAIPHELLRARVGTLVRRHLSQGRLP